MHEEGKTTMEGVLQQHKSRERGLDASKEDLPAGETTEGLKTQ